MCIRDRINVQLKEDAQNLDEVVVVGYGTAKKSDLTGATASLRPDANDASKAVSIDGLLQGKIAGLNVTASMSTPGAASSVTIRGANSLRGDNQPLYVIEDVYKRQCLCFGGCLRATLYGTRIQQFVRLLRLHRRTASFCLFCPASGRAPESEIWCESRTGASGTEYRTYV